MRVAPGGLRETGPFAWAFARAARRVMRTQNPPNLFTTLGRHPRLFRGWLSFARRLMPRGRLPRRDTELVILRVAHLRGCEYEWHHHVRLGRRAGIDDLALERVTQGPAGWPRREAALLTAVDELHAGDLSDATWHALLPHYDERQRIELVMLAAHYEMLATVIAALRIPTDR